MQARTVSKPCELDPFGAEVCLPTEISSDDILINWAGKGRKTKRYFKKLERRLEGFDFQKVKRKKADVIVAGRGKEAGKTAMVEWFVDTGCCLQYSPEQQESWFGGAAFFGILVVPPGGLSGFPGSPD